MSEQQTVSTTLFIYIICCILYDLFVKLTKGWYPVWTRLGTGSKFDRKLLGDCFSTKV